MEKLHVAPYLFLHDRAAGYAKLTKQLKRKHHVCLPRTGGLESQAPCQQLRYGTGQENHGLIDQRRTLIKI